MLSAIFIEILRVLRTYQNQRVRELSIRCHLFRQCYPRCLKSAIEIATDRDSRSSNRVNRYPVTQRLEYRSLRVRIYREETARGCLNQVEWGVRIILQYVKSVEFPYFPIFPHEFRVGLLRLVWVATERRSWPQFNFQLDRSIDTGLRHKIQVST